MLYEPSCHPINPYQSLYIPIISVQHIARHDGAPGLSPKVAVEVGRLEHIMGKKAIHVATKILSGTESHSGSLRDISNLHSNIQKHLQDQSPIVESAESEI